MDRFSSPSSSKCRETRKAVDAASRTWEGTCPISRQDLPECHFGFSLSAVFQEVHPGYKISLEGLLVLDDLMHYVLSRLAVSLPGGSGGSPLHQLKALTKSNPSIYFRVLHKYPDGRYLIVKKVSSSDVFWCEYQHTLSDFGLDELICEYQARSPRDKDRDLNEWQMQRENDDPSFFPGSINARDVIGAFQGILPGELSKHATSEANKGLDKNIKKVSRAGLVFPITYVRHSLSLLTSLIITKTSGVAVAAVLEYIAAEVLELTGNAMKDLNQDTLAPRYIWLAIYGDEELDGLFKDIVQIGGGIVPHVYKDFCHFESERWKEPVQNAFWVTGDVGLSEEDYSNHEPLHPTGNITSHSGISEVLWDSHLSSRLTGPAAEKARSQIDVPGSLICPITQAIMCDPVVAADGHTYEREAITIWLENHNTSPKTNETLSSKQLLPNHNARQHHEEWKERSVPRQLIHGNTPASACLPVEVLLAVAATAGCMQINAEAVKLLRQLATEFVRNIIQHCVTEAVQLGENTINTIAVVSSFRKFSVDNRNVKDVAGFGLLSLVYSSSALGYSTNDGVSPSEWHKELRKERDYFEKEKEESGYEPVFLTSDRADQELYGNLSVEGDIEVNVASTDQRKNNGNESITTASEEEEEDTTGMSKRFKQCVELLKEMQCCDSPVAQLPRFPFHGFAVLVLGETDTSCELSVKGKVKWSCEALRLLCDLMVDNLIHFLEDVNMHAIHADRYCITEKDVYLVQRTFWSHQLHVLAAR